MWGFAYHKDLINVTAQLLLKYAWSNPIYIEKYENLYNMIVFLSSLSLATGLLLVILVTVH